MKHLIEFIIFKLFFGFISGQQIDGSNYDLTKVKPIKLEAVGRVAGLGELYDTRTDQFLHLSIFNSPLPVSSVITTQNIQTKLKYTFINTLEEKFNTMDISAGLKLSILGGLFQLEGSGKFFKDTKKSEKSAKASLINSISTEYEQISITDNVFKPIMNFDALEQIDATHVVVGIQWGGNVFVSVEDTNSRNEDQQRVQGNLRAKLTILAATLSGQAQVDVNEHERSEYDRFNFEIFGDILPDEVPQNIIDALKFMKNATKALQTANNGKGKALQYTLIPINLLRKMFKLNSKINTILNNIDESTVQQCVKLFDNINKIEQKLNDLVDSVQRLEKHISTEKSEVLFELQYSYQIYQAEVKKNLSEQLIYVRSGNGSNHLISDILIRAVNHEYSWKNVAKMLQNSSKIKNEVSFLSYLLKTNVTLLNKEHSLEEFLYDYPRNDVYILCYSQPNSKLIGKPIDIMLKLIEIKKNNGTTDIFAAISNDIFNFGNESKLMYYRNMKLINENFEENSTVPDANQPELWSISFMQHQLAKLINNPAIPIGFIYTQLPNTPTPHQLWPSFNWDEITREYAGLFFRAEGNGSLPFGQIQQANQSFISNVEMRAFHYNNWNDEYKYDLYTSFNQEKWNNVGIGDDYAVAFGLMKFYVTGGENRPKNIGIKIWKRV